jgi:hypothetical protein
MKFRKKPVVIEAVQFTRTNAEEIISFVGRQLPVGYGTREEGGKIPEIVIPTLEGDMRASVGDWIIKGVKGEFYPCKPDIFVATYENAEAPILSDKKFIEHIQSHLPEGEQVICKICGKTAKEIIEAKG